ncbi:hypothetical protein EYB25_005245 [Talaromyces marneffei]|uniref:BZIP domain-containing protein n=1 Tax=Talaromyces marneffei PM1 TaxID=1077442 RepID=A0A093V3M4_TALMA|nr:hypothetical protein EYB25_005245 [Talaromyces marneffei]
MEDLDMKEKRRVQNRESQRRLRARKRNVRAENTRDETESQSKVNNLAGNDFDMEAPLLHGARARKEVFQKGAYPSDPLSFPSWMSSTAELISSPASGVQNPLTSLMPPAPISASSAAQKFHISKPEERLADCDEIQWTQMVATSPPAVDLSSLIPPQDSRLCNTSVHHQSEDLLAPLSFEGNTRVNYQVSNSRSRVLKDTQAEETEKPVKDFKVWKENTHRKYG